MGSGRKLPSFHSIWLVDFPCPGSCLHEVKFKKVFMLQKLFL
jgi:hypothetical protein